MGRALQGRRGVTEIRVLAAADLAAYRALHRLGVAEAFVESLDEDASHPDAEIAEILARGEAWGGFVAGQLRAKLTIDRLPYSVLAHTRWIHALYAHPDARGSGLAKRLVLAAIADARCAGATRFMLWVSAENPRARRSYENIGLREAGRIPGGLFQDGRFIDDVLMCLAPTSGGALDAPGPLS